MLGPPRLAVARDGALVLHVASGARRSVGRSAAGGRAVAGGHRPGCCGRVRQFRAPARRSAHRSGRRASSTRALPLRPQPDGTWASPSSLLGPGAGARRAAAGARPRPRSRAIVHRRAHPARGGAAAARASAVGTVTTRPRCAAGSLPHAPPAADRRRRAARAAAGDLLQALRLRAGARHAAERRAGAAARAAASTPPSST